MPLLLFMILLSNDVLTWESRNKDSPLRAPGQKYLVSWATMCGACAPPDQSRVLARLALVKNDLWVRTSTAILPFFMLGGVAIHEGLVSEV